MAEKSVPGKNSFLYGIIVVLLLAVAGLLFLYLNPPATEEGAQIARTESLQRKQLLAEIEVLKKEKAAALGEVEKMRQEQLAAREVMEKESADSTTGEEIPDYVVAPPCWCPRAATKVEKMICSGGRDIWLLDHLLNASYQLYATRGQLRWLRRVRDKCDDLPCLIKVYQERTAEMEKYPAKGLFSPR